MHIPKMYEEALKIEKQNGNRLWQDAIDKDIENVQIPFELYEGNSAELITYKEVTVHMIYNIKHDRKIKVENDSSTAGACLNNFPTKNGHNQSCCVRYKQHTFLLNEVILFSCMTTKQTLQ